MLTSKVRSAKARVDRVVGAGLVALMAVSVVNVLWQVFTRFVLGDPSSFTEELARYLLIWIGVLGAGYVVGQKAHLALELLPEKLEGRRAAQLEMFIQVCVALFAAAAMVWGGARLVYIQLYLGQTSPALGVPLGLVYIVIPLSGLLMAFYAAVHFDAARHRLYENGIGAATEDAPHRRAAGLDGSDAEREAGPGDDGAASPSEKKALPID